MSNYKIKSIEKIEAPDGATYKRWYKFIIANSYNTITNIRCGSEKEIRQYASQTVKRLNEKYLTNCKVKAFNCAANESNASVSF